MPNVGEYYVPAFTGQPQGLAQVAQIVASLNRLAAGLNRLPGIRELHEDRVSAVVATTANGQAFTVTMTPAPTAYADGIALNVRFPQASQANPTLDILDADGMGLGPKPIGTWAGRLCPQATLRQMFGLSCITSPRATAIGSWALAARAARLDLRQRRMACSASSPIQPN